MAYVISDDCIACGTCIDECPVGAISEGDIYSIDPETCTECGTCADVCPSEKGKRLGFNEIGPFYFSTKKTQCQEENIHLYLYWPNPFFA